jgi:signal transduction histidine kinase
VTVPDEVAVFSERQVTVLLGIAGIGLFAVDLWLPTPSSIGFLFSGLVVAAALFCSTPNAIGLSLLYLVLMGVELIVFARDTTLEMPDLAFANRALSILMSAALAGTLIPLLRTRKPPAADRAATGRRAREALRAATPEARRFAAMVEKMPALAYIKNASGRLVYANPAWHRLFNPAGRPLSDVHEDALYPHGAAVDLRRKDLETLATGVAWEGEETLSIGGAKRLLRVSKFPLLDDLDEPQLACIAVDVTELLTTRSEIERVSAELEQRIGERTAQLEALNKELEAFTYSVSHDLRAPLRGMSGFARILDEDFGDRLDEDGRRYLEVIQSNAAQMGRLIDDLLRFSRLGRQPLNASNIALEPLVHDAFREATAEVPVEQIQLIVGRLPDCRGDANLLRQVLVNLLSNAIKFTRHVADPRVEVGANEQNSQVVYFVRDNGAGFDMRYANKLFGVFQRLHGHDEFPGTGVGLAVVRRIIERHGGRVWADSEPGKGATFYFTLGP